MNYSKVELKFSAKLNNFNDILKLTYELNALDNFFIESSLIKVDWDASTSQLNLIYLNEDCLLNMINYYEEFFSKINIENHFSFNISNIKLEFTKF